MSASAEEMAGVQSRVHASILQKMNASKSMPIFIRHGPLKLGGLVLYDLCTELGIENIKLLRDAVVFADSSAGRMILLNLQYLQLEATIGNAGIIEHPFTSVPYLTHSLLLSVCSFVSKHNMSTTLTEQPTINKASQTNGL